SKVPFHFRIHGNGGEAPHIKEWIAATDDNRFEFGEFLAEQGFVAGLYDADFFVITEKPGVGASFIPSKLIPCIATGTPLLCVCDADGPLGWEVNSHQLGQVFDWNDLESLWQAISDFSANPSKIAP